MTQTRHLTPVGHIVQVEDAINRKIFRLAYRLTTPLATIASIIFFAIFLLFIVAIIWTLVYIFTNFPKL